jgi:hypothetical protein
MSCLNVQRQRKRTTTLLSFKDPVMALNQLPQIEWESRGESRAFEEDAARLKNVRDLV